MTQLWTDLNSFLNVLTTYLNTEKMKKLPVEPGVDWLPKFWWDFFLKRESEREKHGRVLEEKEL
jgi:hypothetical protein